jgi:hypothetical protein
MEGRPLAKNRKFTPSLRRMGNLFSTEIRI